MSDKVEEAYVNGHIMVAHRSNVLYNTWVCKKCDYTTSFCSRDINPPNDTLMSCDESIIYDIHVE